VTAARLGVTIRRPVQDVFGVLADVSKVSRWSPRTIEERLLTPGPLRTGSRRRAVIKSFGGRTVVNEAEILELEPNRKMVISLRAGAIPVQIRIRLEPGPGTTRLDWVAEFRPPGLLGPTAPLLAFLYRRMFQKDLDNLKVMMERGEL
jgi:uncharacterized protein YndB with AHSA1/START domain